jgi:hypothetical protein
MFIAKCLFWRLMSTITNIAASNNQIASEGFRLTKNSFKNVKGFMFCVSSKRTIITFRHIF